MSAEEIGVRAMEWLDAALRAELDIHTHEAASRLHFVFKAVDALGRARGLLELCKPHASRAVREHAHRVEQRVDALVIGAQRGATIAPGGSRT